ncbi:HNH endonuclease signature motif containing protein [Trichormus sp. NMC-1]|uniref:HNH endonuclease n=1 Tax=Trichormus sp. NMC-1 TaxID=1853259 RepID=UPI0008DC18F5|nr:HNH endonuclease signature motif containing protein [Trichormus sp. NMC-1]
MSEKRVTSQQKKAVAERAKGCCEYCRSQARFAIQPFSIEHIIPKSQGGKTSLDNLAFSCQGCNNHKYNKTEGIDPVGGNIVSLYHPRQQKWNEHFSWNEDFSLVIGLTPTGRAMVETLQLNREGVVNLRLVLYGIGEHPPVEVK